MAANQASQISYAPKCGKCEGANNSPASYVKLHLRLALLTASRRDWYARSSSWEGSRRTQEIKLTFALKAFLTRSLLSTRQLHPIRIASDSNECIEKHWGHVAWEEGITWSCSLTDLTVKAPVRFLKIEMPLLETPGVFVIRRVPNKYTSFVASCHFGAAIIFTDVISIAFV